MRISVVLAAAACLALSGPALAQVMIGSSARSPIIGAVLGGPAGEKLGESADSLMSLLTRAPGWTGQAARIGEGVAVGFAADALFATGADHIRPGARSSLDRLAMVLSSNQGHEAVIVGHTDSSGDSGANMSLSYQQAEAIEAYLVERGVSSDRIRVEGRGANEPVANNAQPAGRARNRRIEIGIFAGETLRETMTARYGS